MRPNLFFNPHLHYVSGQPVPPIPAKGGFALEGRVQSTFVQEGQEEGSVGAAGSSTGESAPDSQRCTGPVDHFRNWTDGS